VTKDEVKETLETPETRFLRLVDLCPLGKYATATSSGERMFSIADERNRRNTVH
jgi:hypothetical protein